MATYSGPVQPPVTHFSTCQVVTSISIQAASQAVSPGGHNDCTCIGQHPAFCGHSSAGACSNFDALQVLACVLLADLGKAADGLQCGELAAFCVHPSYRGSGRGDSLLDYVEQSENRPT